MPCYFGAYPPDQSGVYPWTPANVSKPFGGWFLFLLPFVEQDNVYKLVENNVTANGQNEPGNCTPQTGCTTTIVTYNGGRTWPQTSCTGGGCTTNYGIWIDGVHQEPYKVLQCPSDPTAARDGLVYGWWGATNNLANFNAWGNSPGYGVWQPPVRFAEITDGLSSTVLFGEGFANCDTIGRIALYPGTITTLASIGTSSPTR
jgi:hypothetical protein